MIAYRLAADLVLVTHFGFVAFVVLGLLAVLIGMVARWSWVRSFWFRVAHLVAIAIVVAQAWAGIICPLTTLESHLRRQAGEAAYDRSFVAHWLHAILFFEAEPWVFTLCYTIFGALVVATWVFCRPRWPKRREARCAAP